MNLISFVDFVGDLILTKDEIHVFILFGEKYYTLSVRPRLC